MSWTDLKASIASVIKTNGNKEITGALLQQVLNSIVDQVGGGSTYKGVATPSTNPGVPDGPVFYLASQAGTYPNFAGIVIDSNEGLVVLTYQNGWVKSSAYKGFSNLDLLPSELITSEIRQITDSNSGYISQDYGIVASDSNYRYTPLIPVYPNKVYDITTFAPTGNCIFGYEDQNYRNPVLIATTMLTGTITIPENVYYIQISCRRLELSTLSLKAESTISIYEQDKKNIDIKSNAVNEILAMTEFITQSYLDQTVANKGSFIDPSGGIGSDPSYYYTPFIRIYPGTYKIKCSIGGGASIVVYDDNIRPVNVTALTKDEHSQITIPEGYKYIRFSTSMIRYCSLKNVGSITLNYTKEETNSLLDRFSEIISTKTSLISDDTVYNHGSYMGIGGEVGGDPAYSLTEKIKVYPGSKLRVKAVSPTGYCIGGFKRDTSKANEILLSGYTNNVFTIPFGINYIRVTCRTIDLPRFELYYEEDLSLQVTDEDLIGFSKAEELSDLIHEKNRELITDFILTQTTANIGWVDYNNIIHADAGWYHTPYIPVFLGVYKVITTLSGNASIVAYDKDYNSIGPLKTGSIGDGLLSIDGRIRYIRVSTTHLQSLSLMAVETLLDYTHIIESSSLKKEKLHIKDNLKNSQGYLSGMGRMLSGKYSHDGSIYELPITVRRPTAISFRFKIQEDVNSSTGNQELMKLEFENGDHIRVDLMKAINTLCQMTGGEDAWVSYSYLGSIPRYHSGFKVIKNVSSTETVVSEEKRFLTRKQPLVGKDAFHIRYKGELSPAMNGTSIKITSTDLVIFNGATIIATYVLALDQPVKELIDRMRVDTASGRSLENYEIETFGISSKTQSELLKVTEIRIISDGYYGGLQSWGAYIPYAIDDSWHTCEIYMDNMIHPNPVYANLFVPVCVISVDGVQTEIYPSSAFFGKANLIINGGGSNLKLRDLEIQDGHVDGYERINDPTVAKFISKYTKSIIGMMGHFVIKTEEGSDEIVNSGYSYDMSTDRLISIKHKADKQGYTLITIKDLADYYEGRKDIPNKCYFIIFDDIEINLWFNKDLRDIFITNGIIPGLALVNSGTYNDGSGRPEHDNIDVEAFYAAHPNAIRDMRSYGWIPHMHGFTHTQIDGMTYDQFVTFLANAQSKGEEQGMYTDIYTYSFGPHSVNTAKYMEHKGIRIGVSTTNFFSNNATGRYCISRMNSSDIDVYPFYNMYYWLEL